VPRSVRLVAALAAPLLLASCYSFAQPSFLPGEGRDLVAAIVRHGVTVTASVPGDSACADKSLIANALRLSVTDPADRTATRDVWLYSFRERSWATSEATVDACQAEFEAAHPGATVTRIDIPVYRAFGADWSQELTQALEAAIGEAADAGAP
jgi:hypothetical protein